MRHATETFHGKATPPTGRQRARAASDRPPSYRGGGSARRGSGCVPVADIAERRAGLCCRLHARPGRKPSGGAAYPGSRRGGRNAYQRRGVQPESRARELPLNADARASRATLRQIKLHHMPERKRRSRMTSGVPSTRSGEAYWPILASLNTVVRFAVSSAMILSNAVGVSVTPCTNCDLSFACISGVF